MGGGGGGIVELIAADWTVTSATLVVGYTDAHGSRRKFSEGGVHVRCELPHGATNVEVSFEEPFLGGRFCAVDRDSPDLPWLFDEDGDYFVELFRYPYSVGRARFYYSTSTFSSSYIAQAKVEDEPDGLASKFAAARRAKLGHPSNERSGGSGGLAHQAGMTPSHINGFSMDQTTRSHSSLANSSTVACVAAAGGATPRRLDYGDGGDDDVASEKSSMSRSSSDSESDEIEDICFDEYCRRHDQGAATPALAKRGCTDVWPLVIFLLAIGVLAWISATAWTPCFGRTLSWFRDWDGRPCGFGQNLGKPYLFFCLARDEGVKVDPFNPICSESCPVSSETFHECPVLMKTPEGFEKLLSWRNVSDYQTEPFQVDVGIGSMCKPVYGSGVEWSTYTLSGTTLETLLYSQLTVARHWHGIWACCALGIAASFTYLRLLKSSASLLFWSCTASLVLAIWAWAVMLFLKGHMTPSLLLGVGGFGIGMLASWQSDLINRALSCIELACKCVLDMPMLKYAPVVVSTLRIALLWLTYNSLKGLLSCGWTITAGKWSSFCPDILIRAKCIYVLLMWFWVETVISASWIFVVCYAASLWYFKGAKKKGKYFGLSAVRVLVLHHMGSMCVGGVAISIIYPAPGWGAEPHFHPRVRSLVRILTFFSRHCCRSGGRHTYEEEEDSAEFAGLQLQQCYRDNLELFDGRAFSELALNPGSFLNSARWALQVTRSEYATVRVVHGAVGLFQILGLALVFVCGRLLSEMMLVAELGHEYDAIFAPGAHWGMTNVLDLFSLGCALSAVFVAQPFMGLFDAVSDTLLYCVTIEQMREDRRRDMDAEKVAPTFYGGGISGIIEHFRATLEAGCLGTRSDPELRQDANLASAVAASAEKPRHEGLFSPHSFSSLASSSRSVSSSAAAPSPGRGFTPIPRPQKLFRRPKLEVLSE